MKMLNGSLASCEYILWKYLRVGRFVDMLNSSRVYFAAASQFADEFEGAMQVVPLDMGISTCSPAVQGINSAFQELKRLSKISCWHISDCESFAMWQLYAGRGKGIAITTTPKRINYAVRPFRLKSNYAEETMLSGEVMYIDLRLERVPYLGIERFFYKHIAFAFEKEFRLAISLANAEEFGITVPDYGIEVEFDLFALIDTIYLGPSLSCSDVELIRECVSKCGLSDRIKHTSLLGCPLYI